MPILKQVKVRFENGERFSILTSLNREPAFLPNVYLVAMRRSTNVASNTLQRDGRAIMHLYAWAHGEGIDLEDRFRAGDFLRLGEIESLRRACSWLYETLSAAVSTSIPNQNRARIIPMPGVQQVASPTVLVRMLSIGAYLDWLATLRIERSQNASAAEMTQLENTKKRMMTQLKARQPNASARNVVGAREGLNDAEQKRLLDVIVPIEARANTAHVTSAGAYTWNPDNPWVRPPIRFRNSLMVIVLYFLGIRSGELLGLKITDINFQDKTIFIRRAPDDPGDPRVYEPNTKTLDRVLPVDAGICAMLHLYIQETRRAMVPRKGDHLYLWVTSAGRPLSVSGLKRTWSVLRTAVPGLPPDLCPHKLRHNWNEEFSKKMDLHGISEEREEMQRSYQMGWKIGSGTAATYTRRRVRAASNKASLELQGGIWKI